MTVTVRFDRSLVPVAGGRRHVRIAIRAPEVSNGRSRPPLSLALVLDTSGSMAGNKLALTQEAAIQALGALSTGDRISVVAYDDAVHVLVPASPVTGVLLEYATGRIRRLNANGNTNLGGGWLTGCTQVADSIDERMLARCLLLTDGLANRGITGSAELVGHAGELRRRGVTTSTLGVGTDFDESLLHRMADAGGGHFYYAADTSHIGPLVDAEVRRALDTVAREARLWLTGIENVQMTSLNGDPSWRDGERGCFELGSLRAGELRTSLLTLDLPAGPEGSRVTVRFTLSDLDQALPSTEHTLSWTHASAEACEREMQDIEIAREAAQLDVAATRVRALEVNRIGDYEEAAQAIAEVLERVRAIAGRDPVLLSLARELAGEREQYANPIRTATGKVMHYHAYSSMKGFVLLKQGPAVSSTVILRWVESVLAPAVEQAKRALEPHAAASGLQLRIEPPPSYAPDGPTLSAAEEQRLVRSIASPPALNIAFTACGHHDNWFSHWHGEARVALVSLHDWRRMSSVPAAALIAYEGLLHGLRAMNPSYDPIYVMHQESRGCMFDFCQEKAEVEIKLQAGHICTECLGHLSRLGFDTDLVTRAWSAVQQLAFPDATQLRL